MSSPTGPDPAFEGSPLEPPLAPPSVPPVDGDDSSTRRRVVWAFGAAAALFGAGVIGLALPNGSDDGVNVNTEESVDPTTPTQQSHR